MEVKNHEEPKSLRGYTAGLKEDVAPWAGAALLVELYRKAGVEAAAERTLPKKNRQRD